MSPLRHGSTAAPPAPGAHKPQGWVCARSGCSGSLDLTGARSLPPGPSFAAPPCPAGVVQEGKKDPDVGFGVGVRAGEGPGCPRASLQSPLQPGMAFSSAGQGNCSAQVRSRCSICQGLCLPCIPRAAPALTLALSVGGGLMGTVLQPVRISTVSCDNK